MAATLPVSRAAHGVAVRAVRVARLDFDEPLLIAGSNFAASMPATRRRSSNVFAFLTKRDRFIEGLFCPTVHHADSRDNVLFPFGTSATRRIPE
jgi:hypothetical protein